MESIIIDKTELTKLSYPQKDVLSTNVKRRFRQIKLKAAIVDNDQNSMYEITIKSLTNGLFKVKSKIMATGKKYAILDGGHIIPINAITNIK